MKKNEKAATSNAFASKTLDILKGLDKTTYNKVKSIYAIYNPDKFVNEYAKMRMYQWDNNTTFSSIKFRVGNKTRKMTYNECLYLDEAIDRAGEIIYGYDDSDNTNAVTTCINGLPNGTGDGANYDFIAKMYGYAKDKISDNQWNYLSGHEQLRINKGEKDSQVAKWMDGVVSKMVYSRDWSKATPVETASTIAAINHKIWAWYGVMPQLAKTYEKLYNELENTIYALYDNGKVNDEWFYEFKSLTD